MTSIRAVAAWWVVLFHAKEHLEPYLPPAAVRVLASGYIGVDLFFILSGFVIELNYGHRLDGSLAAYTNFLKRRFARIYPLHFVILCVAVLYALIGLAHSGHLTPNYDFTYLPAHFLLIQAWGVDSQLRWNDPAWSISTEMAAYILFPLLVVRARPRRWPLAAQIAAIVALVALLWLGLSALGITEIGQTVMRAGLWRCLCEFAIGAVLCTIFLREQSRIRRHTPTLLLLAAPIVAAAGLASGVSDIVFVPVASALLVLGLAFANARGRTPLDARVLVYLGDISYSTYLSHFLLLVLFKTFQPVGALVPPLQLALYFLSVAATSILLYTLVETRAQRLFLERMGLRARRIDAVGAP